MLALVALSSCIVGSHRIDGTISAPECEGTYNILDSEVQVKDETGRLVGVDRTSDQGVDAHGTCTAPFSVVVSTDARLYKVLVGSHDGGTYTLAELEDRGWRITLTLP